jgi:hypothetical protein
MKHAFSRLLMVSALGLPLTVAHAAPLIRVSDPSICIDGMVTDPASDDLEPIMAAADGGCIVPETLVSI